MKRLLRYIVSAVVFGAMLTVASAQNRNSAAPSSSPYKWCLEENVGGSSGGTLPWLCRFKTLEQCQASRTSPADRCSPNTTGQRS
jgi:uncharacterized membrane protein